MATAYEIPLVAGPQQFTISLSGVIYTLALAWCDPAQTWLLSIGDASNNPVITGLPLVTGVDLLAQYTYLGIPGQLRVQTDHDAFAVPTYSNLGSGGRLYYLI